MTHIMLCTPVAAHGSTHVHGVLTDVFWKVQTNTKGWTDLYLTKTKGSPRKLSRASGTSNINCWEMQILPFSKTRFISNSIRLQGIC